MTKETFNNNDERLNKLISSNDLAKLRMFKDAESGSEDSAVLISLSLKMVPKLLNVVESLENVLELANDFETEGLSEEAARIREAVIGERINENIVESGIEESIIEEDSGLVLISAAESDLGFLLNSGPGMPNVEVVKELLKNLANNVPVWTIKNSDEIIIGAVSLVKLANGDWTTTTFVRAAYHTPALSKKIKEAARKAVLEFGGKYVVLVSPDNQKAIDSMAKVWSTADVSYTADGTLSYSYTGIVEEGSWDSSSYLEFTKYLNKRN